MKFLLKAYLVVVARLQRPAASKGQTLVEYTLILGVLSVVALAVFTALGARVASIFSSIDAILDTAQSS